MMAGRHPKHSPLKVVAALLALMAGLVRGLIAPGFMPDIGLAGEGEFRLVICTPTGAKALGERPGEAPAGDGRAVELCPFAALGQAATLAEPAMPVAAVWHHATQPAAPAAIPAAQAVAALRARGPPLIRS
jgi:hypothetical protein